MVKDQVYISVVPENWSPSTDSLEPGGARFSHVDPLLLLPALFMFFPYKQLYCVLVQTPHTAQILWLQLYKFPQLLRVYSEALREISTDFTSAQSCC